MTTSVRTHPSGLVLSDPFPDDLPRLAVVPATLEERLTVLARIAAARAALTAAERVVRDRLDVDLEAERARTGRTVTRKAEGIGRATRSNPTPKPVVVDDDAWRAWAAAACPGRTATRLTVDGSGLADAARRDPRFREALAGLLAAHDLAGALGEDTLVAEDLLDDVHKGAQPHTRTADDGTLVTVLADPDTGELVGGVELRTLAVPTTTITLDRTLRDQLAVGYLARLGLPAETTA